jgi:phosphate transport system permease protein
MNKNITETIRSGLAKRYRRERIFKSLGLGAIAISFVFLVVMIGSIASKSAPAFSRHYVKLTVNLSRGYLGLGERYTQEALQQANYDTAVKKSLYAMFPDVKGRRDKQALRSIISSNAPYTVRDYVMDDESLLDTSTDIWVLLDDDVDVALKEPKLRTLPESDRRLKDKHYAWLDKLQQEERVEQRFNARLFTEGDSREPEQAGIQGALVGSLLTMLVTLLLSLPIGVAAAVYLEEFAPKNRWIDLIEININNLAAVPSIVFGLLGLAVFLNVFGMPRSAPLVGGLVLTLMTLPTIIISSRAAIKSVPPSIREAALGLGASKTQTVFQHVVPLAMPGILTGTIIGMAQALGETAPLLMIGMVAFVRDVPLGIFDPATVLPVQIYIWADSPERSFVALTSAAIMILLVFLMLMNLLAVILRKKFERRW